MYIVSAKIYLNLKSKGIFNKVLFLKNTIKTDKDVKYTYYA